jgi:hypothetical protein
LSLLLVVIADGYFGCGQVYADRCRFGPLTVHLPSLTGRFRELRMFSRKTAAEKAAPRRIAISDAFPGATLKEKGSDGAEGSDLAKPTG